MVLKPFTVRLTSLIFLCQTRQRYPNIMPSLIYLTGYSKPSWYKLGNASLVHSRVQKQAFAKVYCSKKQKTEA